MKVKSIIVLGFTLGIMIFSGPSTAVSSSLNSVRAEFDFQAINGTVIETTVFEGKPIVLDWAASWCGICKSNQRSMNAIYDDYKDFVNFVSISYGRSGDDLDDVKGMKGNYEWTFGLDINNYADVYDVSNGYVWILDENLELYKSFNYTVVSSSELRSELDQLVNPITITTTASNGSTVTVVSKPSVASETPVVEDTLNLGDNPLFLGFIGFSIIGIIVYVFLKQRT